jgi:hypothetical protein
VSRGSPDETGKTVARATAKKEKERKKKTKGQNIQRCVNVKSYLLNTT